MQYEMTTLKPTTQCSMLKKDFSLSLLIIQKSIQQAYMAYKLRLNIIAEVY